MILHSSESVLAWAWQIKEKIMLDPTMELARLVKGLHLEEEYWLDITVHLSQDQHNALMKLIRNSEFAFYSLVGSWNYGLADENSDVDFKVTYFPCFDHFYDNKFPKFNLVTSRCDFTIAPLHQFVEHMLKGNINFFEILYPAESEYFYTTYPKSIISIMDILRKMIPMNAIRMFDACRGTAQQKISRLDKYSTDNEFMRKKYGYNLKEAAHAIRQLHFLKAFLKTGKIDLQKHFGLDTVWGIKKGHFTRKEIEFLYKVIDIDLSDNEKGFHEMDQTETKEWTLLREDLDYKVRAAIREKL